MRPLAAGIFKPPFSFETSKENRRLIGEKKNVGGLSGYKIPQSLSAGVVFAGDADGFENLYRTAGGSVKFENTNHLTLLSKPSYALHTLAAAHW